MRLRVCFVAVMVVSASVPLLSAQEKEEKPKTQRVKIGASQYEIPASWKQQKPKNRLRAAEFDVPAAKGDANPTSLVVFHFGVGGGGGVDANLERWKKQIQDQQGEPKVEKLKVGDVPITTLDISGTYLDRPSPFAQTVTPRKDYRMLAAVVETDDGPYFFKMVGAKKTVAAQEKSWKAMLKSLQGK